jgi:hypothetical protein
MSKHSRSRHDIETRLDAATVDCLPFGLLEHQAFDPHMWRKQEHVLVNSCDGVGFIGQVAEVSWATGRVLIMIVGRIPAKA